MKRIKIFFAGILFALLLFSIAGTGCKKLESEPKDWFGEELVFDSLDRLATVAAFNQNDLYNYLPGGFNRVGGDFLDAAAGDAIPSTNNALVEYYTNRRISLVNNPDPYWANSYYGIRKANIFLQNIGKVPLRQAAADNAADILTRQYWRAEARFIRCFLYWELVKRYGGVPLVGDKIFTLEDDLQIPRNKFDECINYIVRECDMVKDSLRKETLSDGDWGRIPRGAAIALKCRALLYAASPLFNGGGVETDPIKKALTGYPTVDPARWQAVIAAAEEFKTLPYYGLYSTAIGTGATAYIGYAALFTVKKNNEIILAKQSSNSTSLESFLAPIGYSGTASSLGLTSPTQNFIDAFPMLNGLQPFNPDGTINVASGYSATAPYTNRDPRLDASIFYNNGTIKWLGRAIETFEGGLDKPNTAATSIQTKTGYYLRKFLGNFQTGTTYSNQSHNFPLFRYAEILLNYAEALNEMNRVEEAVTQIVLIRKRAGITAGTNGRCGIKVGINAVEMREVIRNERRIELSFEEHRFWDIRRWKTAATDLTGPLYGMKITKTGTTFTYTKQQVSTMLFDNKLYHMPIPYDESIKNRALIQNEGW